jgi:hypothetical protein
VKARRASAMRAAIGAASQAAAQGTSLSSTARARALGGTAVAGAWRHSLIMADPSVGIPPYC